MNQVREASVLAHKSCVFSLFKTGASSINMVPLTGRPSVAADSIMKCSTGFIAGGVWANTGWIAIFECVFSRKP